MKFGKFVRAFTPVIAIALAAGVSGCDGAKIKINGEDGVKLADLDLTGTAPDELVLLGPDEVKITQGARLAITVEGDAAASDDMRFSLKDGTLAILRKDMKWSKFSDKTVVINVTMPPPREITMAGSGKISSVALAPRANIVVAGSGTVETPNVAGESIDVNLAGSGLYRAAGNVSTLKLLIAGSGSAELDALKADQAKVTIAGSGSARFASDGDVKAEIMGSGEVTVRGRARCTVSTMGSGKLNCETAATPSEKPAKPK
jgi:hypothetical protein